MGDMLSQAELDALLGGLGDDIEQDAPQVTDEVLSFEEMDTLGEFGNINMGTAATTLFALLQQKVMITTPKVKVVPWGSLADGYDRPAVGIRVGYREGLDGSNILILNDRDVKIIADLMMGGSGEIVEPVELNEWDMSAIGEAMNQMVGSAATSLSTMIGRKVDIETPQPFILSFEEDGFLNNLDFSNDENVLCVSFRMEVGSLIDSEIMQIWPLGFARELVETLQVDMNTQVQTVDYSLPAQTAPVQPQAAPVQPQAAPAAQPYQAAPQYQAVPQQVQQPFAAPQNVQPAQFQSFESVITASQSQNMNIIMDVPLDVTMELGRTKRKIQEILDFAPGMVIELDKLAGEPIDVLVNGKYVAKGEVVVIDENFGIRITDIVNVEKRI